MTSRAVICGAILEPRSSWPSPWSRSGAWSSAPRRACCTAATTSSDAIRIATRYVGPEKGAAYVEDAPYDSVIARLEPGHLRIWDFADESD